MAINDFLTLATLAAAIVLVTPFLGRYIHRVMEGERVFLSPIVRPVERTHLPRLRRSTRPSSRAGRAMRSRSWRWPPSRSSPAMSSSGCRTSCRFNQGGIPAMTPDLAFNTSVSFETNTNWQNYSGESGATYLSQATMLAVRNFTSAATGLAVAIALIRGLTRRQRQDARQLLGRPDARRPLHPAAGSIVGALVLVWQGVPQTWDPLADRHDAPGRPADHRHGAGRIAGMDQGIRQQRRRLLQRELVASLREPDAADELAGDLRAAHLLVLADLHVRPVRQEPAPGLDDLRGDGGHPAGRRCPRDARRSHGQPALPGRRRPGRPGEHGGQGDAFWRGGRRPVHGRHDRHQHRRDQLVARQRSTYRRARPALQHGARRGHAGWDRRRACTACSSSERSWRSSSPA